MTRSPMVILIVSVVLVIAFVVLAARRGGKRDLADRIPAPMFVALRIGLGILFLLLGVLGAFLPVLPGWLAFLLAAVVFFPQSRFAVATLNKAEKKLPRVVAWLRRWGIGVRAEDQRCDDESDSIAAR